MLSEPLAVTMVVINTLDTLKAPYLIGGSLASARPFDRSQLARRQHHVLGMDPECSAFVASAEDIVLAKLEWYRLGGETSERQWHDILGVLKVQHDRIDRSYLRGMATDLHVTDLLERALEQAECA